MRLLSWRLGLGIAALLGAVGCSSARYVYRPEENATARVSGKPAAFYAIPQESPHGEVRVATLGIAELQRTPDSEYRVRALHVRLVVDNNDDTAPWQVDTREQIATLDGYGPSRPAFAKATPGRTQRASMVTIAPGTSRTIDLYYPLPAPMQQASKLPSFDVLWRVQTPESPVAERTSFERLRVEPPPQPAYYGMDGWGPGGYGSYDPFWPGYSYWGAPPVLYYTHPPVNNAPPAAQRIR